MIKPTIIFYLLFLFTQPLFAQEKQEKVFFLELQEGGDIEPIIVKNGEQRLTFVYQPDSFVELNLLRGDSILINWEERDLELAGDTGTVREKVVTKILKIKDSKILDFRSKYGKDLVFQYPMDSNYTETFKDYLYHWVEYYLTISKTLPVEDLIIDKSNTIFYSIEDAEKNERSYTLIGIGVKSSPENSSILQWLYLDNESHQMYEYDLGKDELIEII
ncbi:hypothetical protein M3B46_09825 [Sphingobacterium daejeonense]|uniref:hypothetical protein n=1 Tax=Sphingobacterium daejeonense TaxID=371142 RepID=UPI0021A93C85|nr:hypothetical protein [Sphingobacterium daejeonense]MCT1531293.1 hypothetical protein [Sphingobacterium daejeonense]